MTILEHPLSFEPRVVPGTVDRLYLLVIGLGGLLVGYLLAKDGGVLVTTEGNPMLSPLLMVAAGVATLVWTAVPSSQRWYVVSGVLVPTSIAARAGQILITIVHGSPVTTSLWIGLTVWLLYAASTVVIWRKLAPTPR